MTRQRLLTSACSVAAVWAIVVASGGLVSLTGARGPDSVELTVLKSAGLLTPEWVNFYGLSSTLDGQAVPVGAVIRAYDPQGVPCGEFTVHTAGQYGLMPVYSDDPNLGGDQGAQPGDTISFTINGCPAPALGPDTPVWSANGDLKHVELSATCGATFSTLLQPDWNLISIPLQLADPGPGAVLDSISDDYDVAYVYSSNLGWLRYEPGAPDFANTLAAITPAQGVWVHAIRATVLEVAGTIPPSTTIPLVTGWNLIGYPADDGCPVTTVLDSIMPHVVAVYGYDAGDQTDPWKRYIPGAGDNDLAEFEPGRGYWLEVNQECELVVEYY